MEEYTIHIAIFIIGFITGIVDILGGVGGFVSIPFLIFAGLPADIAVATNKVGGLGSSLASIRKFAASSFIS